MSSIPRASQARPTTGPAADSSNEAVLANLLEQMADDLKAAGTLDLSAWQGRYPQFASELERLAPTLQTLVALSESAGEIEPLGEGIAGQALGDFLLVRELGRGGMGIVYEAQQRSLARRVALKILPTAAVLDPRTLQRFKNEALAAAALDHPHIVDVYGIGCERGVHYYAMRLIEGCTLAQVIEQMRRDGLRLDDGMGETTPPAAPAGAPAPSGSTASTAGGSAPGRGATPDAGAASHAGAVPRESVGEGARPGSGASTEPNALLSTFAAAGSLRQAGYYRAVAALLACEADGLQHAHDLGVIHRDIRPSNLMLDSQGKLWLTDFGLAHIETNQTLTATGDLLGTLRYMSPEQALSGRAPLDHRTDLYSLGATLYELITLRPVYSGTHRAQLLQHIAASEPALPRRFNPHVPTDLETIALKLLEKDPRNRHASAREVADDLRRFQQKQPISGRRPAWTQRVARWAARHRAAVAAAGSVALLAALVIAAFAGWSARDAAARRETVDRLAGERLQTAVQARQAVAAYRAALALQPEDVRSRNHLAALLELLGQRQAALQEYQRALAIAPHYALAHWNRAACLQKAGQFETAARQLERALAAVSAKDRPPTQTRLAEARRLAALAAELSAASSAGAGLATAQEAADAGRVCYYQGRPGAAVQFWTRAFDGDAALATKHRYDAACAALRAARDDAQPAASSTPARDECRRRALAWLSADFTACQQRFRGGGPLERMAVVRTVRHWGLDPDLSIVREPAQLASLPAAEQAAWRTLWADIDERIGEFQ
jgi:tetratricopeptide (TPR) repeat protein